MPIIEEFTIAFGTNVRDLKRQLADAQNALDGLEKKLNKTADDKKRITELEKSVRDFKGQIKGAEDASDKLSSSLIGLGVKGLAAFAGFDALKAGVTDAFNFNLELEKQERLTGEAGRQLAIYDATFQRFGANKGEFLNWFSQYSQYLQQTGGDVKQIIPNLRALADELHNLPEDQARQRFQQVAGAYGLPPSFFLTLREGSKAIDEIAAKEEEFIKTNEESEKASRKLEQAWEDFTHATQGSFTTVLKDGIPIFRAFAGIVSAIVQGLSGIVQLLGSLAHNPVFEYLGSVISALGGRAGFAGGGASIGGATAISPTAAGRAPLGIRSNNPGNLRPGGVEAVYPTLAAGLAAEQNQLRRYGARGINTIAGIASTWAPSNENDTQAYIRGLSESTGFAPDQPLNLNDPAMLAAVANAINRQEEGPAYGGLVSSGSSSTNSVSIGTVTIHTQATDAGGIADAITSKLNEQFRATIGNYDDGIMR